MWWEFHHLLRILDIIILLAIFVHSLAPVLFSIGIPTIELCRVNSKLLASLLLWSEILRLLIIESPFRRWSCNPAHISGAPFNQCLIVYVFLEHTSLYHLNWKMLSPWWHTCGNPSFGNLEELSLSPSATPHPLLDLMMNSATIHRDFQKMDFHNYVYKEISIVRSNDIMMYVREKHTQLNIGWKVHPKYGLGCTTNVRMVIQ